MGQILVGCLGFVSLYVLFPFFAGTLSAFAIGGWMFGVGAIIYSILALIICAKVEDKKGMAYFLLMIPLYILEIWGLYNWLKKS